MFSGHCGGAFTCASAQPGHWLCFRMPLSIYIYIYIFYIYIYIYVLHGKWVTYIACVPATKITVSTFNNPRGEHSMTDGFSIVAYPVGVGMGAAESLSSQGGYAAYAARFSHSGVGHVD